ncbi:MAG: hypothetical protein HRF47_13775 [Chloroflexota bacterium]|jgi:hypothetical protein
MKIIEAITNTMSLADGSVFDTPPEFAIVVPVNTMGVPRAGLAKEVATRYPEWAQRYRKAFRPGGAVAGEMVCLHYIAECERRFWVSLPTKTHWMDSTPASVVEAGLELMTDILAHAHPRWRGVPLAVPAPGCGLGGAKWEDIYPLLVKHLGMIDRRVILFRPFRPPVY